MAAAELTALAPPACLGAAAAALLLLIAFDRDHLSSFLLSLFAVGCALALLPAAKAVSPIVVGPLFLVDGTAVLFLGLIYLAALVALLFSYPYLERGGGRKEEYYLLVILFLAGASAVVCTRHFASLFLGLETLSISLYGLISYPRRRGVSVEAGIKYLVLASVSSSFLLFGMALVYHESGKMELPLPGGAAASGLCAGGAVLIAAGAAFKLALVPFHTWAPDVYEGAPSPVTALVATVSKGAVFSFLLKAFPGPGTEGTPAAAAALTAAAVGSMFAGNLLALRQTNLKRLMGCSSVAQMGYIAVAFLASGEGRTETVIFALGAYFTAVLGTFGLISALPGGGGDAGRPEDYRGLFRSRPLAALCLSVMLLSLAGLPLTAGFVAKFLLVRTGLDSALLLPVGGLAASSVLGLVYYLRVVAALFDPPETAGLPRSPVSAGEGTLLVLLLLLLLWLGIWPAPALGLIAGITGTHP